MGFLHSANWCTQDGTLPLKAPLKVAFGVSTLSDGFFKANLNPTSLRFHTINTLEASDAASYTLWFRCVSTIFLGGVTESRNTPEVMWPCLVALSGPASLAFLHP